MVLGACLPWSEGELGKGYYYLPNYEAKDVGYDGGSTVYKSTQKNYFQIVLIQGGILEVNKNMDFILIGQNKQQLDLKQKTKVYYYWIIDKNNSKVYGPYILNEYLEKKNELGVPEKLKLKCERE